jgi:hypothetical protein
MKTFKLIIFFVLLSNGYSYNDTESQDKDTQTSKDQESVDVFSMFLNDMGFIASSQIASKKKNLDNLDKKLGFGSFNCVDGQYSVILVKNSTGDIAEANSVPMLDKNLEKWLKHSKSSSPDDNIA